jgi:DNA-binding SARP family transcriptional activator
LQLLVVAGGAASEATIVDALWPEADGDQAQQALSIAVHRLRALLGDASIVERRAGELSLDRRRVFADVWAIESLLESAAQASAERRAALLQDARKLLRGPPVAVRKGDSPSWLMATERRLAQRFTS